MDTSGYAGYMLTVDLNADVAEFDNHTNSALLRVVSSANVACGVHAGDPLLMSRTLRGAEQRGVVTGAHPSYPDRANFGRETMMLGAKPALTNVELHAVIRAQLASYASMTGGVIKYVKPHGALYNDAQSNDTVARILAYQADLYNAAVVGQPGSRLQTVCEEYGINYIAEVFADRGYDHYGRLIRRGLPHSVIEHPPAVARRVVQMVTQGTVETYGFKIGSGPDIPSGPGTSQYSFSKVDTICLHGDTRGAYEIAVAVREALEAVGVTIASPLAVTR